MSGSSQLRPILFLDVDGVLHKLRLEFKDGKMLDDHCFDSRCCTQLQRVVQETGTELVLSSSWRCYESSRETLAAALARYGLSFSRWTTVAERPGGRAGQILEFLSDQGRGVTQWAVVDDEDVVGSGDGAGGTSLMMQVLASRFVRTHPDIGLTEGDADKLIRILKDENDSEEEEDA